MGGSLRRSKRFRPKLSVKPRRKGFSKSKVPHEITEGKGSDVEAKLGSRPSWSHEKGFMANYKEAGLISDPNIHYGRNSAKQEVEQEEAGLISDLNAHCGGNSAKQHVVQESLQEGDEPRAPPGEEPDDLDEDFAAVCGKQRPSGPAPPPRLTANQRLVVQRLVAAHGDDAEAMARDRKLNKMLHPTAKLRKLLESYRIHGGTGVGFRVPSKRLW